MAIVNVTDVSFKKDVLESGLPVLVDFWASWCGPCKMIAPIIDELSKEYDKKLVVAKLDVDNNSKIASHYGIMSIPTLMFFKGGKVIEQTVGVVNKVELKRKIEEHIR